MFDLITIGNITADLYFSADELTKKDDRLYLAIGGKYRSEHFNMSVGGGGANVSIGGRKNGLKTAVVGMVGNNVFRKSVMQRLKQAKVNTSLVLFSQTGTNVSVLLLNDKGERTVITHQTSHKHVLEDRKVLSHVKKTRAVYFGTLPDASLKDRQRLTRELRKHNVIIFTNVGPADCCRPKKYINELLKTTDVLIVNTHEFADLVNKKIEKINFHKDVVEAHPILKDKVVVVTAGRDGSFVYEQGRVYHQSIIKEKKIVDTTGVGDGYTAGFISSYLKHENIQLAMKAGSRYASKIIQKRGAN